MSNSMLGNGQYMRIIEKHTSIFNAELLISLPPNCMSHSRRLMSLVFYGNVFQSNKFS